MVHDSKTIRKHGLKGAPAQPPATRRRTASTTATAALNHAAAAPTHAAAEPNHAAAPTHVAAAPTHAAVASIPAAAPNLAAAASSHLHQPQATLMQVISSYTNAVTVSNAATPASTVDLVTAGRRRRRPAGRAERGEGQGSGSRSVAVLSGLSLMKAKSEANNTQLFNALTQGKNSTSE
ncbi:hypothetical protein CF319_g7675 [Tilletia indica]|nr:hypothetical protein CF319_g7675 [Tilletia indica]KAE8229052.1 hypothetical protein CF326_g5991 [Tilletia indica]